MKTTEIEELENILKTEPDRIIMNGYKNIKHYKFPAETLLELSIANIITIIKYTLDETIVLNIENKKIKYWK